MKCYFKRIELFNLCVKVVIEMNFDVLWIVDELDVECKSGKVWSKIYGILFFVKDNMVIRDKMEIMVGCWVLVGIVVLSDVIVVEWFWVSGGVLFGKVNFLEWVLMWVSYYLEVYFLCGG